MLLNSIGVALTVLSMLFFPAPLDPGETDGKRGPGADRVWVERGEMIQEMGADGEGMLYKPGPFRVEERGMYVFDYGDSSVKMYSHDGRFIRAYGQGPGQGPGEFANPTDIEVDGDGRVWVVDPVASRLTIFEADGSDFETVRLQPSGGRIALDPSGRRYALQIMAATDEATFQIRDAQTHKVLAEFGRLMDNQAVNAMAVDGRMDGGPNGVTFRTTFAGRLMKFSWTGETMYRRPTVDDVPMRPVVVDEAGGRRMDAPVYGMGLHTPEENSLVSVVSYIPSDETAAVDVYTKDGEYRHSISLPAHTRNAAILGDMLVVLRDTSIQVYRYAV